MCVMRTYDFHDLRVLESITFSVIIVEMVFKSDWKIDELDSDGFSAPASKSVSTSW